MGGEVGWEQGWCGVLVVVVHVEVVVFVRWLIGKGDERCGHITDYHRSCHCNKCHKIRTNYKRNKDHVIAGHKHTNTHIHTHINKQQQKTAKSKQDRKDKKTTKTKWAKIRKSSVLFMSNSCQIHVNFMSISINYDCFKRIWQFLSNDENKLHFYKFIIINQLKAYKY